MGNPSLNHRYRKGFYSLFKTLQQNRLVDDAYMPIKVNASGGMAFMYVYTLLMFPQYIIILLRSIFPTNPDITSYNDYFSLSSIQGVVIYMILMLVLSVAFTFVNIDPTKISEAMRESGDFIPNYRPGKETQSYLSKICYLFGTFSGFFMAFLGGVPLLFALGNDDLRTVSSMTGIFMMITGMSFMILDEFQVIRIRKQYTSVFENEEN
ncbi:accessory Sec system protein translocase subunit SecY2 [Streptococcus agalactiae]